MTTRPVLLIPGIYNSGPTHWQSLWQTRHAGVARVEQADWDHPVCDTWVRALDDAIAALPQPPILVAHSLGCLVAVHWAARHHRAVHALLLVAVPDPSGPNFPADAPGLCAAACSAASAAHPAPKDKTGADEQHHRPVFHPRFFGAVRQCLERQARGAGRAGPPQCRQRAGRLARGVGAGGALAQ